MRYQTIFDDLHEIGQRFRLEFHFGKDISSLYYSVILSSSHSPNSISDIILSMFTGIVQGLVKVSEVHKKPGLTSFSIEAPKNFIKKLSTGASITIDEV